MSSAVNPPSRASALRDHEALQALRARWQALAPRERMLVRGAGALAGLALVWWIAIAPAVTTLRSAPAAHRRLDDQLQRVRVLAAQARQLQSQPRTGRDEAQRALAASVQQRLGTQAQLGVAGDRATLNLQNVQPTALAAWLVDARTLAHVVPSQAQLMRGMHGGPGGPGGRPGFGPQPGQFNPPAGNAGPQPQPPQPGQAHDGPAGWTGSLVLDLPAER
ncbi:type II secretion system protein GspM [Xylophilus sp.]|uniref:type II secretion system protein GspM n=1 Tax=Xylophilus sp. TaxID=2653893 RepID=UPI0013B8A491|nr:type II secretion system protein GspM [Xylophilus sp.]KAF1049818.1 MAG: hypothetical protein GAK38_00481 [Xylophilus sp.]